MTINIAALGKHAKLALRLPVSWAILSSFLVTAHLISDYFAFSFPAPLSAMLALFLALQLGLLKLHWLQPGTQPLLNFMPLFFVPAAAKVVEHSPLIAEHWLVLLLCLFLVPALGLISIGFLMQRLRGTS
ncbi:CidA/LrgA family protein [Pseudoalteromonas sp. T1lg75]|uniref:CidA/LrgA family protein n=1 Tax=Pseudoalteromonas sp. T1lg75 TaxID=2077102 RepID=UPI00131A1AE1|nr:CidA/LrgA family protein [Pseudoalteromonas sp. T1lg75]